MPENCPSDQQLRWMLDEELDDDARTALFEHIEQCAPCQAKLEQLELSLGGMLGFAQGMQDRSADRATTAFHAKAHSSVPAAERVHYFGDFELLEQISDPRESGMGVVWKARQVSLNRIVAVKLILAGQYANQRDIDRFRAEGRAAAQLKHPNIVAVHEMGIHDGQDYIAMDLIEGSNLSKKISQRSLSIKEAVRLLIPVVEAIQFAHARPVPVTHRDLKPANILLDENETPFLTDFGIAKLHGSDQKRTASGEILGTANYMPPEQARGFRSETDMDFDPRPDVYGLGAVLYCMLSGRPPHYSSSLADTLIQVLENDPVPLRQQNTKVPKDLETICHKCLEKEPRKRYQTAQELADELGRIQRGEPIHARPITRFERAWRWCKRKPAVASLLAAVVFALVAGTVVSTAFGLIAKQNEKLVKKRNEELQSQMAMNYLERASRNYASEHVSEGIALSVAAYQLSTKEDTRIIAKYLMAAGDDRQPKMIVHSDRVLSVAISPDGQQILTGGDDHIARLWDVTSGIEVQRFQGHQDGISFVGFSPDGCMVLTGGADGAARIWNAATGEELHCFEGHQYPVTQVRISADGRKLLTTDYSSRLWDVITEEELRRFEVEDSEDEGPILSFSFSPDSQKMLTGDFGAATLRDVATGEVLRRIEKPGGEGFSSVAFSPDGQRIVTGDRGGTARLWDASSGKELRKVTCRNEGEIVTLAFSPDGRQVLIGQITGNEAMTSERRYFFYGRSDLSATLWEIADGDLLQCSSGNQDFVSSISFSLDGRRIVTGSYFDLICRVWELRPSYELQRFNSDATATTFVAFSPDGQQILTTSRRGLFQVEGTVVVLWDATTGKELRRFEGHGGDIMSGSFLSDGQEIFTVGDMHNVRVWNAVSGKEVRHFEGIKSEISSTFVSPDGRKLLTGRSDGTAWIWDSRTGKQLLEIDGNDSPILSAAFSPDGTEVLTSGNDGFLKFWDLTTGKHLRRFKGDMDCVFSVAFSPNGNNILAECSDGTVKLWEAKTGRELLCLAGNANFFSGLDSGWSGGVTVAISPDGGQLLTGGSDGIARLWDARTGKELRRFGNEQSSITSLAFSHDGRHILTGYNNGTAILWDASNHVPTEPELVAAWGMVRSGLNVDGDGVLRRVTSDEWSRSRNILLKAGVEF